MIEVRWSMTIEDDADFLGVMVKNHEFLAPPWAEVQSNAERTVELLVETWFDTERWLLWFGDEDVGVVLVEISSPENIKGRYKIDLLRPVKALAKRTRAEADAREG